MTALGRTENGPHPGSRCQPETLAWTPPREGGPGFLSQPGASVVTYLDYSSVTPHPGRHLKLKCPPPPPLLC